MVLAKKSLGQNFLMHAQTAERIVGAARVSDEDIVLEIGPGTGMLTKALLAQVKRVLAVEADDALALALSENFATEISNGKLEVIHEDIRAFDPTSIKNPYHVVANIPYYITGEIVRQFLIASHKPLSMTLLMQKEVVERIARNHGKESLLSLSVKAFGEPEYCFTVPRGAFRPAPNVDSAVLSIRHITPDAFPNSAVEQRFFQILHAGFAHKRKRLAKNLEILASAEQINEILLRETIDPNIRSEDLTITQWKTLANELKPRDRAE